MKSIDKSTGALNQLRLLLRDNAILFSDSTKKIVDRRGKTLPWIFYNWQIALTAEGTHLIAACLLERLQLFEGTQLASYGFTSVPIVTACVVKGDGRYSGLAIRETKEQHGTCNHIEGKGDYTKKVIILDDCICSGNSMYKAITILEAEGYSVEGCICLVDFPWRGGTEWIRSLGYQVDTLFDVWRDLEMPIPPYEPTHKRIQLPWDRHEQLPNGLTPADAARAMMIHYGNTKKLPLPPTQFDTVYDSSGGVYISIRDRKTDYRLARDGFVHLDASEANLALDLALATYKIIQKAKINFSVYDADRLKIGVSMLSRQENIRPGQVDFFRYGLTLQSAVQPWKVGGALPNTQFFSSDIEQYRQALYKNTRLSSVEPYVLYRHTVTKSVETGASWPPFGYSLNDVNEPDFTNLGNQLMVYIRALLESLSTNRSRPDYPSELDPIASQIKGIGISLYYKGLVGCWTAYSDQLNSAIQSATIGAWNDPRYQKQRVGIAGTNFDVVLSLFYQGESLGKTDAKSAAHKVRLGIDTLVVQTEKQRGTMLSIIPCQYDWSKEKMAQSLVKKVGITTSDTWWKTYETKAVLSMNGVVYPLTKGFGKRVNFSYNTCITNIDALSQYILHQRKHTPLPSYCYWPTYHKWDNKGTASRILLALNALYEGGELMNNDYYKKQAIAGLSYCGQFLKKNTGEINLQIPDLKGGPGAEALFLLALSKEELYTSFTQLSDPLFDKVSSWLRTDGMISPLATNQKIGLDHDILPGVVLLAVANYSLRRGEDRFLQYADAHLDWYQRRFRLMHPWGMVWWHIQAWTSIYRLLNQDKYADFVFELADWALDYQLGNGAFLVDYAKDGPGFHTGCVLEGIADAWWLARKLGDKNRVKAYSDSWYKGMAFMNQLIISETDTYFMTNPADAIGGVRQSLTSCCLRIDFTGHMLMALTKGIKNANTNVLEVY